MLKKILELFLNKNIEKEFEKAFTDFNETLDKLTIANKELSVEVQKLKKFTERSI